jgi:hypothetical protein
LTSKYAAAWHLSAKRLSRVKQHRWSRTQSWHRAGGG